MPKQRPRPRRRAAPVNLNENLAFDEFESQTRLLQPTKATKRKKRSDTVTDISISNGDIEVASTDLPVTNSASSNLNLPVTTPLPAASSYAMPSAEDIATNLMKQLQNSGLLLPGTDKTVNTQTLSTAFTAPPQTDACRNNSNQQIPVQLQPPLISDPVLNNYVTTPGQSNIHTEPEPSMMNQDITDLGIDNDIMGSTARYMLNNTLPLGYHVNDATKQKIWNHCYVDFYALLPNFNLDEEDDDDILYKNRRIKISKTSKPKELLTMHQWNEAFDIFISIYLLKYPTLALPLIKYGSNIRLMSKQFGFKLAKSYDETFRRVRKIMKFEWTVINDDLWRTAYYQHFKPSPSQKGAQSKSNPPFQKKVQQSSRFPVGYCWTYCDSGECANKSCKLKHQCVACGNLHATVTCREYKNKKPTNTSKGKEVR